jgi:hypothetical protein
MAETARAQAANAPVSASAFGLGRLKPGTVQITLGPKVGKKDLHDMIEQLTKMHGCEPCGLGGLDLLIRTQDPRVIEAFQHIDAVKDISVIH